MTPQESSMLEDLVRKVEETELTEKDPEAEQLLQEGLGRDPDAIYKLAQTVLVQNLALNQARTQIQQMQQTQQQAQPARATSFLGGLLGHRDPAPPAPQPLYQQVPYQQAPAYQAPPQYATAPLMLHRVPALPEASCAAPLLRQRVLPLVRWRSKASNLSCIGFGSRRRRRLGRRFWFRRASCRRDGGQQLLRRPAASWRPWRTF